MSLNKIASGTDYRLDCKVNSLDCSGTFDAVGVSNLGDVKCGDLESNEITCLLLSATATVEADTCFSTQYAQSGGDQFDKTAVARYTLGDVAPVNFVSTPSAETLLLSEKKAFDLDTALFKYSLNVKGNFTVVANLAPAGVACSYSMTIDGINDRYLNAVAVFKRGQGISANGAGAGSAFLTVVDTSVLGVVRVLFQNITHTQTPQGFSIVNDFEFELVVA